MKHITAVKRSVSYLMTLSGLCLKDRTPIMMDNGNCIVTETFLVFAL